jgi:hypothetical protein
MPRHDKVLTPPQKAALLECFQEATALLPVALRPQFILVGGTASIAHSSCLWTDEVDVAASVEAHICFRQAITQEGSRFNVRSCQTIEFNSRQGFPVAFELLELGGLFVESIAACEPFLGGFVASPGDLILNRAETVVGRGTQGDVDDLRYLLAVAARRGELIPARGESMKELVLEAAAELTQCERLLLEALMPIFLR